MGVIEGYASATSVRQGENLAFHVRDEASSFRYEIRRRGNQEPLVASGSAKAAPYEAPGNAYEIGCGWPAAFTLTVPEAWSSGLYVARLSSAAGRSRDIAFVVRPRRPGERTRVLLSLPVTTGQAYNGWGGKTLYPTSSSDGVPATRVSFDRPTDELVTGRELAFIRWLEDNRVEVDYCTSIDLHEDPGFLSSYQLLLSVGHDEYWSIEMRDNVEGFVARGGNVAFFSANVCYWQVRFENGNRTMVCYKSERDPLAAIDPRRATLRWASRTVDRPENLLTGVGFRSGAGWWNTEPGPRPAADYTAHFSEHWVFAGTNLKDGSPFGGQKLLLGYETDAARFTVVNGVPVVTGDDGTPRDFVILASADLTSWEPGGQGGWATMGLYRRDRGVVFTAATVDWARGLGPPVDAVHLITANVLNRLSRPNAASPPLVNADFTRWSGDVPEGWERAGAGAIRPASSLFGGEGASVLDAAAGPTSLGQQLELLQGRSDYRVSCWVKASAPGATLRLESTRTSKAVAAAEHAGDGAWARLAATGRIDDEGPLFPGRVTLGLSAGTATFCRVLIEAI